MAEPSVSTRSASRKNALSKAQREQAALAAQRASDEVAAHEVDVQPLEQTSEADGMNKQEVAVLPFGAYYKQHCLASRADMNITLARFGVKPEQDMNLGKQGRNDKRGKKDQGKGKGKDKGKDEGKGKSARVEGYRLNVKNIAASIASEEKLREIFAPFGTVADAQIKTHDDGSSRGFGYVVLKDEAEGQKAIAGLNNKQLGHKTLNVCLPERRADDGDGGYGGYGDQGKGKSKMGQQMDWSQQSQQYAYMQAAYMQQAFMQQAFMQQAFMQQAMMQQSMTGGQWPGQQWPGQDDSAGSYEGSLKSISEKNGYGFIVCAETYKTYGRDVYIDKEILPAGAKPTDRIKFTVALNAKQHPKAVTASMISMN